MATKRLIEKYILFDKAGIDDDIPDEGYREIFILDKDEELTSQDLNMPITSYANIDDELLNLDRNKKTAYARYWAKDDFNVSLLAGLTT